MTLLFSALAGKRNVISFDMGGTTAKACLIEDGKIEVAPMLEAARVHRFRKGSGLPIKAPVIEMIETGAGGGSIAAADGGKLRWWVGSRRRCRLKKLCVGSKPIQFRSRLCEAGWSMSLKRCG